MKHAFSLLCLTLLFSVSCVQELMLDPGEEPMVVVDCVLCNESPQTLRLFFSKPPSYSEMTPITDAEVELIDKTEGKTVGLFSHNEGREWILDYAAIPEHEYRLEIRVSGHDLIYAEDTMPAIPEIEVKNWEYNREWSYNDTDCKYGDSFVGMTFRFKSSPKHLWMYALNYNETAGKRELAEEICTDYPWVDSFNLTNKTYIPEKIKVSQDVYSSFRFETGLYPQLEGEQIYRRFLCLESPEENGLTEDGFSDWFLISGSFVGSFLSIEGLEPYRLQGYLVCTSLSENYDVYLRDAIQLQQLQESRKMDSIYFRDNINSNIKGGIGILGAMTIKKLPWIRGWDYKSLDIPAPNYSL